MLRSSSIRRPIRRRSRRQRGCCRLSRHAILYRSRPNTAPFMSNGRPRPSYSIRRSTLADPRHEPPAGPEFASLHSGLVRPRSPDFSCATDAQWTARNAQNSGHPRRRDDVSNRQVAAPGAKASGFQTRKLSAILAAVTVGFSHRTDADNDRTLASQPRYQGAGPLAEVPRRVRTNQLPRRFSIRKRSPRLITPLVTGSPRARKKIS
jgi:hypothetical protein